MAAARYQRWGIEMAELLRVLQSGATGAILAEASVARLVSDWERGLPELRLKALLNEI